MQRPPGSTRAVRPWSLQGARDFTLPMCHGQVLGPAPHPRHCCRVCCCRVCCCRVAPNDSPWQSSRAPQPSRDLGKHRVQCCQREPSSCCILLLPKNARSRVFVTSVLHVGEIVVCEMHKLKQQQQKVRIYYCFRVCSGSAASSSIPLAIFTRRWQICTTYWLLAAPCGLKEDGGLW